MIVKSSRIFVLSSISYTDWYVCAGAVLGQVASVKKKVSRHSASRNSAHLTGSSLQEDLMKLISPEYTAPPPAPAPAPSSQPLHDSPLSKLPKKTLSELSLMKSRSRENIARLEVSL